MQATFLQERLTLERICWLHLSLPPKNSFWRSFTQVLLYLHLLINGCISKITISLKQLQCRLNNYSRREYPWTKIAIYPLLQTFLEYTLRVPKIEREMNWILSLHSRKLLSGKKENYRYKSETLWEVKCMDIHSFDSFNNLLYIF